MANSCLCSRVRGWQVATGTSSLISLLGSLVSRTLQPCSSQASLLPFLNEWRSRSASGPPAVKQARAPPADKQAPRWPPPGAASPRAEQPGYSCLSALGHLWSFLALDSAADLSSQPACRWAPILIGIDGHLPTTSRPVVVHGRRTMLEIRTRTSGTYERCHPQGAGTWRRGGLIQAIGVSLQVRRNSTVPPLPRY